jgi:hypothetical protein
MVVDEERQALYVYGGTDPAGELSGMFRYDIRRGRWEELLCVGACAPAARHLPADARPRPRHSVATTTWASSRGRGTACSGTPPSARSTYLAAFDRRASAARPCLFRDQPVLTAAPHTSLSDFWTVSLADPERPSLSCLTADYSKAGLGPLPAFTQRAVLDSSRDEIIVLSGLMKEPSTSTATTTTATIPLEGSSGAVAAAASGTGGGGGIVKSELWAFSLATKKWDKIEEQVGDEAAVEPGAMDVDDDGETRWV